MRSLFLALAAALAAVSCTPSRMELAQWQTCLELRSGDLIRLIEVTDDGQLSDPRQVEAIAEEIRSSRLSANPIDRCLVVSYGWGTERDDALQQYLQFIDNYQNWKRDSTKRRRTERTLILCIAWDSKSTSVQDLIDYISPIPYVEYVGLPLDLVLFVVSFWSTATTADFIGFWTLPTLLSELHSHLDGKLPPIALVGHSFGARAIADSLIQAEEGGADWLDSVTGALLLHPATHEHYAGSLAQVSRYPVVITHNTYDKANKLLYPVANAVLNTGVSFLAESMRSNARHHETPEASRVRYTFVASVSALFASPAVYRNTVGGRSFPHDMDKVLLGVSEISSVVELGHHPIRWLSATVSEIPILGSWIRTAGRAVSGNPTWGAEAAGLFSLGWLVHSAGASPQALGSDVAPVRSHRDQLRQGLEKGLVRVDMSTEATCSMLGYDMSRWYASLWTWLDPVGAHTDIENAATYQLIQQLTGD